MVAFYILTKGEHPFGEERERRGNLLDGNPVYLDKVKDPAAKDLISWMLKHDPKDRPTAEEALRHPYLQPLKQQFELLCSMGNQREIRIGDNISSVAYYYTCKEHWTWSANMPAMSSKFNFECVIQYYTDQWNESGESRVRL